MAEASPEAVKFCNPDGYNGPEIEVDASTLTEDQWQARRADHLGGSDISAIFGANKFKTNLDLFYAKTGKQPIVPEEETSQSRLNKLWGHISEGVCRRLAVGTVSVQRYHHRYQHLFHAGKALYHGQH